jgi:hypothetical protein
MSKTDSNLKLYYIYVFCAAAVLYVVTCAPGVVWQDSGVIQYRVWHNDIEGRLGLALSHPLYYLIAIAVKYVPLGEFAYRVNVLTAVISAFAVANLFLLLRLLLGETFPSLLGAATFALSHTFWRHSTIPETYGLTVTLLLLELIMLLLYARTSRVKYLYFLALINGLAIANHMLASIALVCYLVLFFAFLLNKQIKIKHLGLMAIFWIVGAIPYEYLIIKNIIQSGDVLGTLASAAFGNSWQGAVLSTNLTIKMVKENLMYIVLNFPTPNILFVLIGFGCLYIVSPKRWYANVLMGLLILYFIFAFRYTVQDRYAFFIPFYCMISIIIGAGSYSYLRKSSGDFYLLTMFCLIVVPAYIMMPKIADGLEIKIGSGRKLYYRDDSAYFLYPWKMDYKGAEQFANQALFNVRPPAIIYADATVAPPLLYAQEVQKKREGDDIKIISSIGNSENSPDFNGLTIEKLMSERNVYVISPMKGYCPDFLLRRYKFELWGVLWHVVEKDK